MKIHILMSLASLVLSTSAYAVEAIVPAEEFEVHCADKEIRVFHRLLRISLSQSYATSSECTKRLFNAQVARENKGHVTIEYEIIEGPVTYYYENRPGKAVCNRMLSTLERWVSRYECAERHVEVAAVIKGFLGEDFVAQNKKQVKWDIKLYSTFPETIGSCR